MYHIQATAYMPRIAHIARKMMDNTEALNITSLDSRLRKGDRTPSGHEADRLLLQLLTYKNKGAIASLYGLLPRIVQGLQLHCDFDESTATISRVYVSKESAQHQTKEYSLLDVMLFAHLTAGESETYASISTFNRALTKKVGEAKALIMRYLHAHLEPEFRYESKLKHYVQDYFACRAGRIVPLGVKLDSRLPACSYAFVLVRTLHHKNAQTYLRSAVYRKLDKQLLFNCDNAYVEFREGQTYPEYLLTIINGKTVSPVRFGTAMVLAINNVWPLNPVQGGYEAEKLDLPVYNSEDTK